MYYLLIYLILSLFCVISLTNIPARYKIACYWLSFLIFVFTAGFRFEIGTDYFSYQDIFNKTNRLGEITSLNTISEVPAEPLYLLLNSLFKTLNLNLNLMFLCISIFTSTLLFNSLSQYLGRYKFLALVTYFSFVFFTLDMSGIRQSIAVSIFFFSFRFIISKSFPKFLFSILIASLFHISALFCIIFYSLFTRKFKSVNFILILIPSLVIILFKIQFIYKLVESILEKIIPETAILKLLIYSSADKPWEFNIKIVLFLTIFLLLLINRVKLEKKFLYFNIALNSLFFYLLFRMTLWESIEINGRINFYFIFGLILSFPMLYHVINKKLRMYFLVAFFMLNFYQSSEFYFYTNMHNPYQNYLIHKIFNLKSSGEDRFEKQKINVQESQ